MMQMRLDLETISVVTTQSSQEQIALQGQLMNNLAGVDERIARVEEMLHAQADQVRENQLKQHRSIVQYVCCPSASLSGEERSCYQLHTVRRVGRPCHALLCGLPT